MIAYSSNWLFLETNRAVPFFLFRDWQEKEGSIKPRTRQKLQDESERKISCKLCRHPVTRQSAQLEVNGKSKHTFFNPAGIVYEITCYQEAGGCLVKGELSNEFSWFQDYNWRYSFCSRCLTHLGWFFEKEKEQEISSFFGLIANRLVGQ